MYDAPLSPSGATPSPPVEEASIAIRFVDVTRSFAGIRALKGVSFAMARGSVTGIVGENGAGKTTLMNVLGGVLQPDSGAMVLDGRPYRPENPSAAIEHGVGFIHQELNLFANLSIAENIFIDRFPTFAPVPLVRKKRLLDDTRPLLEAVGLEVDPATLVETLSPGERQLVEIAKALAADARIIIFDEPTTSLTAKETERLFGLIERLKGQGTAIAYISHILKDVMRLADTVVVLRDGELVETGPVGRFSIASMIASMVGRTIENLFPAHVSHASTHTALSVHGLGRAGIARDISFDVYRGEIFGLFGLMGSGRTEVARMIFGVDHHDTGTVTVHGTSLRSGSISARIHERVAFVTEDRREEGLLMDVSVAENIALVNLPSMCRTVLRAVDADRVLTLARDTQARLRIKSGAVESASAKSLSGGNQQKVVIGKWLAGDPQVLILDEPTRGIDVGAKYEVYTILHDLAAAGTAILVISSELEELVGICDRIAVMSRGEMTGLFDRSDFDSRRILSAAFDEAGVHGTDTDGGHEAGAGGENER